MFKAINTLLVCAVLGTAFFLYRLEYSIRGIEREIVRSEKSTAEEREKIKLLDAEWASLTRPARLQEIAEQQLGLKTLQAQQFINLQDLPVKLQALPAPGPTAQAPDTIGKLLEKLQ